MMGCMQRSPQGTSGLLHGSGIASENLGYIVGAALNMRAMPEEIEHPDRAVWTWWTDVLRRGQCAAQGVGGDPSIRERVSQRSPNCWKGEREGEPCEGKAVG